MKIVFLDIDGVLNSRRFLEAQNSSGEDYVPMSLEWWAAGVDPQAVELLNDLLDRTGAKVVVSSSWRLGSTLEWLEKVLKYRGFTGALISVTPRVIGGSRGEEIDLWLRNHGRGVRAFVALDDDIEMAPVAHRHVKTEFTTGLLPKHVELAVQLLS